MAEENKAPEDKAPENKAPESAPETEAKPKPVQSETAKPAESSPVTAAPAKTGGSNKALIVVIIIVVVLAILGIGGYFGWKYLTKNTENKSGISTTASATPTATKTSASVTPVVSSTPTSTSTSASTTTATSSSSSDYVISDSSTREISKTELTKLTPWQLKVARNEIYARHGRAFVHKDLQCYFAKKSWYKVDTGFSESSLNSTENQNVATILAYEKETNSPLFQTDSGCDTNS